MSSNTTELGTMEEAQQFAAEGSGPFLVLSPETLDQIKRAEAAGGFEGGMSGASGGGGFSAPGSGGADSSSASDPAPIEPLDTEGEVLVGAWIEEKTEKVLTVHDVLEALEGGFVNIILVPKNEIDRWLGRNSGETA